MKVWRWWLLGLILLLACVIGTTFPGGGATARPGLADRVVIEKSRRNLTLYRAGTAIRVYKVALGSQPIGAKTRAGDGRTPEGIYTIDWRKTNSAYHQALHVSYPNALDRAHAAELGASPGGDIMIHGLRNGLGWLGRLHRLRDWTRGCIALTDVEIDEISRAVPDGTTVEILP